VPVGDVYKVSCQATLLGSQMMNDYAFQWLQEDDPTNAEINVVAEAGRELWRNSQADDVVWRQWRATQLWGPDMTTVVDECRRDGGLVYDAPFTGFTAGDITSGDTLPPQCAMVVTWITGFAGRRRRGRCYGFGFSEQDQTGGVWGGTPIGAVQTRLTAFLGLYGASGTDTNWRLGVWSERIASGCKPDPITHHLENVELPSPSTAFTPVTTALLRTTVFTQRRRVTGVGL